MDKRTILLIVTNLLLLLLLLYCIKKKRKIANFILLITFSFIFLSVVEFTYRTFFSHPSYEIGNCGKDFFRYDSSLGYVINKTGECWAGKINKQGDTIYKATYTIVPGLDSINKQINRRVGFEKAVSPKEIVFLGCSFTFGQGLNDTESLPYQAGKMSNLNTVNLGVTGYGIHQVYQLFNEQYSATPNDRRIFVYSFLYDHILRANGLYEWNLQGPLFKMEGDSLINAGPIFRHIDTAKYNYIHYVSLLGTFTFLKDMLLRATTNSQVRKLKQADYDKCFLMIRKMAQAIQRTGGRLIVIGWDNDNWANLEIKGLPLGMIEKELSTMLDSRIQFVKVSSILDLNDSNNFISQDGHPSAAANEKIARGIARFFE